VLEEEEEEEYEYYRKRKRDELCDNNPNIFV